MDLFDIAVARKLAGGSGGGGGSSDFSTVTVTVTINAQDAYVEAILPYISEEYDSLNLGVAWQSETTPISNTLDVVLYKNQHCSVEFFDAEYNQYTDISATGSITVDELGMVLITGDGTITIS